MTNGESKSVPNGACAVFDAEVTDRQLLGRFNASRDELGERAFAVLVGRHGPMVLRVCHQILGDRDGAEDAFQATFLILARKSGSIRQPELLANWLYGVALRTAWEAKMRDGQRRRREIATTQTNDAEPAAGDAMRPELDLICREEYQVLHEEVSRLPERYRLPVVLCELEGLTYQEAARRLRCPIGTLGVRLSRARERLRVRMIQRGIVPTAAIATALLVNGDAAALMSEALIESTARAAVGFAAGDAAATGLVSSSVLGLTRAVLKLMALARFQLAAHIVFTVAITATLLGIAVYRRAPAPVVNMAERASLQQDGTAADVTEPASPVLPMLASERPPAAAQSTTVELTLPPFLASAAAPKEEPEPKPTPVLSRREKRMRDEQARGELLFAKEWMPDDPMSHGGDGLGPLYNESSCVACHGLGSPGGAGPDNKNVIIVTLASRLDRNELKALGRIHPGFRDARSTVLHRFGTDPEYASWRRTLFESRENAPAKDAKDPPGESVDDRIRKVAQQTSGAARMNERARLLEPVRGIALRVTERNTPALFGAGRIDAIPSEVILEEAAQQPHETRGRVSRDRKGAVGRFGWKAQVASLHEFVRGACAGELGLEVPGHSQSASPLAPDEKPKGLDMSEGECDDLVAYVRGLPSPVVVDPKGPQGSADMWEGRRLLADAGCTACHTPSLGPVRGLYSDLLLHDMGASLADSGTSYGIEGPFSPGDPSPGEWRTPPLWGFRDSAPYMHDGRAENLEEAVALHGGQGAKSARAFFTLSPLERFRVEAFLKSLVAPSAASAPGVMLAAELEARIVPDEERAAEARTRKLRQKATAREQQERREQERRKAAELASKRAQMQLPIAINLEKSGKVAGALEFYRTIVRKAPQSDEARTAADRIDALEGRTESQ